MNLKLTSFASKLDLLQRKRQLLKLLPVEFRTPEILIFDSEDEEGYKRRQKYGKFVSG